MKKSLSHLPKHKQKQLEYLAELVKVLQKLTKKICQEKIENWSKA
jgi:hypothetical protein